MSLAEFVFKSDASLTSLYDIIFYKRNIIWKAIRSVELTNKRLPEPHSIDDDTISQNQVKFPYFKALAYSPQPFCPSSLSLFYYLEYPTKYKKNCILFIGHSGVLP